MWIETGSGQLPDGVEEQLVARGVVRDDRSDNVWINLDTGAILVLACSGGWRTAGTSHYRVFHRASGGVGELIDVTFGVVGTSDTRFDVDETGSDTYSDLRNSLSARITETLGARQNWAQ